MRVVREVDGGIVRRLVLLDDAGSEVEPVTRFLSHLSDSNYSPNTVCAYGYDLRHLAVFLDERSLGWNDFFPPTALEFLGYLRRVPSRRPAQRLGLTVATEQGRLLSAATVQRALAATSSFFDWAIAADQYTAGENPMQRKVDHALGRVPHRHQPFVGTASRQQPVRRTVRVRLPLRLPRPMTSEDIDAVLASLTTLRDLAIFLLMLDGGLRPGEVLCLQLGYTTARTQLVWPLGRMLLRRGDPDLTALGVDDLDELRAAIDAFTARLRLDPVREFYSRAPVERPPEVTADGYLRSAIARLHAVHVLLFDLGQLDRPPTGRVTAGSWVNHLTPADAPPKIRAVIERYLRLHLEANLDRPQTVRHAGPATHCAGW